MTGHDHHIIFTAPAFLAVAEKEAKGKANMEKIGTLAVLLETFCADNVERAARKTSDRNRKPKRPFYSIHPLECQHQRDQSEIRAHVEASGNWETVAVIRQTTGVSAEAMAEFICYLINDNQKNKSLLLDAMAALESCLEESKLTYSSEQAADSVLHRIKERIA